MEMIQRNNGNSNMLVLTRDLVGEKNNKKHEFFENACSQGF